jgi:N-acetylmuramoyl-L-alanine amidase
MICIDPGHGGRRDGVVYEGVVEDDVVLELAFELKATLESMPIDVMMTRTKDEYVTFDKRGELANQNGADFYLSIHVNSNPSAHIHGAEMYHWPGNRTGYLVSKAIAAVTPKNLRPVRIYETIYSEEEHERWLQNPRNVLKPPACTAVLAEVCFATNDRDRAYLLNRWGKSSIVSSLRSGICKYLELKYS